MKYTITTLGCKVNTAESEMLARELEDAGWTEAAPGDAADLCVINTCTVTGKASMQSRQAIRHLQRRYPKARVVVTGCYAQTEPEVIQAMGDISAVLGSSAKEHLTDLLFDTPDEKPAAPLTKVDRHKIKAPLPPPTLPPSGTRTRPFLKIQDGCDHFCTYCIVPHARGRSRSLEMDAVLEALRAFERAGYLEVVLTGIHLGAFGADLLPDTNLFSLLKRIETENPVERVRLSSIEPNEISDQIIQIVSRAPVFCDHFHLPLQSGDNDILQRMRRPYDRDLYQDRVLKIREALPTAAIGTDVLLGFPGESEDAFANTVDLIESLPLTYLHVFPFSPRKGTPAYLYPNPVPSEIIKERCSIVRKLGASKRRVFLEQQVGTHLNVLIEQRRDRETGLLRGMSSNYQSVLVNGDDSLKNSIVRVKAISVLDDQALMGDVRSDDQPYGVHEA